jgi:hypothetical protein
MALDMTHDPKRTPPFVESVKPRTERLGLGSRWRLSARLCPELRGGILAAVFGALLFFPTPHRQVNSSAGRGVHTFGPIVLGMQITSPYSSSHTIGAITFRNAFPLTN